MLEGVADYPPEIVQTNMLTSPFSGRSLWRIILRIPSLHVDMTLLSNGEFFRDYAEFSAVFGSSQKYMLHSRNTCSNDGERLCTRDLDCLRQGRCVVVPDAGLRVLSAGGSTAVLAVPVSGSSIVSLVFDVAFAAFKVRIRCDVVHCCARNVARTNIVLHKHYENSRLPLPGCAFRVCTQRSNAVFLCT